MCEKRRYRSEKAADAALHSCEVHRVKGFEERREQRHYYCEKCFGWHLTSMPRSA